MVGFSVCLFVSPLELMFLSEPWPVYLGPSSCSFLSTSFDIGNQSIATPMLQAGFYYSGNLLWSESPDTQTILSMYLKLNQTLRQDWGAARLLSSRGQTQIHDSIFSVSPLPSSSSVHPCNEDEFVLWPIRYSKHLPILTAAGPCFLC